MAITKATKAVMVRAVTKLASLPPCGGAEAVVPEFNQDVGHQTIQRPGLARTPKQNSFGALSPQRVQNKFACIQSFFLLLKPALNLICLKCAKVLSGFGVGANLVQEAYDNMVETIRMVAVDCASDEINSVRDMVRPMDGSDPLAPKLELIGRDKAHGSRRGITRPWKADVVLTELLDKFVLGSSSMIQKIDRSPDLRRIFTKHCSALESGFLCNSKLLISLRSAKHRFESLAGPLGTWCVWYQALIMTAREIVVMRSGVEVQCSLELLADISTERCVLMSLLADASDDALMFTRGMDSWDNMDPSITNSDVYCFLIRIAELYSEGKVCNVVSYTKYMLDSLQMSPVVVPSGKNCYKTIGCKDGVSQAIIQGALQHLSCWVKLCIHVLKAEFPDFELVQRFSVLDLQGRLNEHRLTGCYNTCVRALQVLSFASQGPVLASSTTQGGQRQPKALNLGFVLITHLIC
jgi:hypothetical protein